MEISEVSELSVSEKCAPKKNDRIYKAKVKMNFLKFRGFSSTSELSELSELSEVRKSLARKRTIGYIRQNQMNF